MLISSFNVRALRQLAVVVANGYLVTFFVVVYEIVMFLGIVHVFAIAMLVEVQPDQVVRTNKLKCRCKRMLVRKLQVYKVGQKHIRSQKNAVGSVYDIKMGIRKLGSRV